MAITVDYFSELKIQNSYIRPSDMSEKTTDFEETCRSSDIWFAGKLNWVPGHINLVGNEKADELQLVCRRLIYRLKRLSNLLQTIMSTDLKRLSSKKMTFGNRLSDLRVVVDILADHYSIS